MSFTHIATRSIPMVSCASMAAASLSFVPTPSRRRPARWSRVPVEGSSNSAPKPPSPAEDAVAWGPVRDRANARHQIVGAIDVDTGVTIAQAAAVDESVHRTRGYDVPEALSRMADAPRPTLTRLRPFRQRRRARAARLYPDMTETTPATYVYRSPACGRSRCCSCSPFPSWADRRAARAETAALRGRDWVVRRGGGGSRGPRSACVATGAQSRSRPAPVRGGGRVQTARRERAGLVQQ